MVTLVLNKNWEKHLKTKATILIMNLKQWISAGPRWLNFNVHCSIIDSNLAMEKALAFYMSVYSDIPMSCLDRLQTHTSGCSTQLPVAAIH
jgi:hypothetical protein